MQDYHKNMNTRLIVSRSLIFTCLVITFVFWSLSFLRHLLLQSNAYDLGLFDQWIWLASKSLPPISSMEDVHLLADHGAWLLYLAVPPYFLYPSSQWLLGSQAISLSFTAIPLYLIAFTSGLNKRLCWLVCGLWWLQPVVFNVNLFDFHPEVWGMPILAFSYFFSKTNKPFLWLILLFLLIGCRDGLILVVIGIGLEQALRKRWLWSVSSIGMALLWLAFLNKYLYPSLTGSYAGPKAAASLFSYLGNSFDEVLLSLITKPNLIIQNVDWVGGFEYLLLISLAIIPFLRLSSFLVLIGALPLILVNFLSEQAPQRTLIHHYSLPIAVIAIVAVIEGLSLYPKQSFPWKKLLWSSICWAILAKPWFFTGPYLSRVNHLKDTYNAINMVSKEGRLYTTSYLVPHLTHREYIDFPESESSLLKLPTIDVILLNPKDPGWGSNSKIQQRLITYAKKKKWNCREWSSGLELCNNPFIDNR
tara:strand:- start:13 stop:1437 length:1425 start_codon:yes stop_codon:yes gene_type:complete